MTQYFSTKKYIEKGYLVSFFTRNRRESSRDGNLREGLVTGMEKSAGDWLPGWTKMTGLGNQ